jgi:hypothetical protein
MHGTLLLNLLCGGEKRKWYLKRKRIGKRAKRKNGKRKNGKAVRSLFIIFSFMLCWFQFLGFIFAFFFGFRFITNRSTSLLSLK